MRDVGVNGVQTCALPIFLQTAFVRVQVECPQERLPPRWLVATRSSTTHLDRVWQVHLSKAANPPPADRGQDRKSVVQGKSVDLGGRRIIKKNKTCTD